MKFNRLVAEGQLQHLNRCGVPGVDFNGVNAVPALDPVDAEQAHEFKFAGEHLSDVAPLPGFGIVQLQRAYAATVTEFSGMEFGQADQLTRHPQQATVSLAAHEHRGKTVALEVLL